MADATGLVEVVAEPGPIAVDLAATALLIIDMQRDFMEPGGFGETLGNDVSQLARAVAPIAELLTAARGNGMTVIHTREGHLPDLSDALLLWAKDGKLPVKIEGVPGVIATKAEHYQQRGVVTLGWHFSNGPSSSHPGGINALMADGSVRFVRSVVIETYPPASVSQNNLRQIAVAFHSYEAAGIGTMTVTPTVR